MVGDTETDRWIGENCMKDLLTISEFAEYVHRSERKIRKEMNKRLEPYVVCIDGTDYIKSHALFDLFGYKEEEPTDIGPTYSREVSWWEFVWEITVGFFITLLDFWPIYVGCLVPFSTPILCKLFGGTQAAFWSLIAVMGVAIFFVLTHIIWFIKAKTDENADRMSRVAFCGIIIFLAAITVLIVSLCIGIA